MPNWATCCVICLFIEGAKWKHQQTDVQAERQIDGWMEGHYTQTEINGRGPCEPSLTS